jgi:hypothetical protein
MIERLIFKKFSFQQHISHMFVKLRRHGHLIIIIKLEYGCFFI